MEQSNSFKSSPLYVAFASQKGGVGKSTLAEITAGILFYEKGYNILVVDCDQSQDSFLKLRERDKKITQRDPEAAKRIKAHFEKFGKPAYPVLRASVPEAIEVAESYLKETLEDGEHFDLVIFDLPGTQSSNIMNASLNMDYVISPVETDVQSLTSSYAYVSALKEFSVSPVEGIQPRLKNIYLLWNKVKQPAPNTIIDFYQGEFIKKGLDIFETKIPNTQKISRELTLYNNGVFRCSFLPPDKPLRRYTNIDDYILEFIHLCLEDRQSYKTSVTNE